MQRIKYGTGHYVCINASIKLVKMNKSEDPHFQHTGETEINTLALINSLHAPMRKRALWSEPPFVYITINVSINKAIKR